MSVRAIDVAGNVDATPATHTWMVDTVAPDTALGARPPRATSSRSAAFTHSADALGGSPVAGYECRLDGGAWGACQDTRTWPTASTGSRSGAIDAAGNVDGTPAAYTWTVDTAARSAHGCGA